MKAPLATNRAKAKATGGELSNELFALVQKDQGYAFISDDDSLRPEQVFAVARGALKHSRTVVRLLEKWLDKYDER